MHPFVNTLMKKWALLSPPYFLVFLLSWFGLGATPIPIAPFINLPLIFVLVRTQPININVPLFFTLALGAGLAYHESKSPFGDYFDDLKILVLVGSVISAFTLIPMTLFKFIVTRTRTEYRDHSWLIFPLLWTATWSLISRYSPLGSWGDWGYAIYNSGYTGDPLMQMASIGGLSIINLFLALFAQMVADYMIYSHRLKRIQTQSNQQSLSYSEETPLLNDPNLSDQDNRIKRLSENNQYLMITLGVLFVALLVVGSIRLQYIEDNNDHIETIAVGCLLPTSEISINELIKSSDTLASNHNSKIVLWSESAINIRDEKELNEMMDKAKSLTKLKHFFLGMTYSVIDEKIKTRKKNMLTLIGPDGLVFNYQKVHPVPLVESYYVEAGQNDPPIENITMPKKKHDKDISISINVSGAICLDMDFPEFLGKAAKADLILSPAQTWSAHIGLHHLRMASVRAIENGYWILRCDGSGASGLVDPLGRIRNMKISTNTKNTQLFSWDLPIEPKIQTIYAKWGEWLIWGSLGVLCVLKLGWIVSWVKWPDTMEDMWDNNMQRIKNGQKWIENKYEDVFKNVV